MPPSANLYLASATACMTAALFGYSVGFIGGVLVLPSFLKHLALDHLEPHELLRAQGTTVTSWLVGTLVGVTAAMPVYSKQGRKACLFFCGVLYVAGAIMQISGIAGIRGFDAGRFLNGIGVGAGTLVSPLYISEIATPASRAMLMSGYQVSLQLSALIGFWAAYLAHQLFDDASPFQYQLPVALQLFPGIALILGTLLIPEAPQFLAEKGDHSELTKTIAWLRGRTEGDPEVAREADRTCRTLEATHRAQAMEHKGFIAKTMSTPSLRRRLGVGIGLMIAQNMVGLNAINYYAPSVFRSAGFTTVTAMLFLTGLFGIVKLVAAIVFMFVCVRIRGNRFWLNLGSAVCAISMFALTGCILKLRSILGSGAKDAAIGIEGIISVLAVYCFAFFFGVSLGPISWNVCGEIFPPALSAKCCTITTLTQWIFQIAIAGVTPILIESVGEWTYVFFGGCCVLSLIFCFWFVPETRGVRVGFEMDQLFERSSDIRTAVNPRVEDDVESGVQEVEEVNEETPLIPGARRHRSNSVALAV